MKEAKEIFIHIGYPKTASTSIQNAIFSNLKEFDLVGQPATRENEYLMKIIHTITDCETIDYNKEEVLRKINDYFEPNRRLLISEESLSTGSSLSGRVSRYEIANRLYNLFPSAKIMIVLREQKSIIKSYYLQKKKVEKNFSLTFDEWFVLNKKNLHKENIFQYFHYDKIIEIYEGLFGKDNLHIFLYEELNEDKNLFFSKLSSFLNTSSKLEKLELTHDNRTVTQESLRLRFLSERFGFIRKLIPLRIKKYISNRTTSGTKIEVELSIEQIKFINEMYQISNDRINESYNLNLSCYNYSVK